MKNARTIALGIMDVLEALGLLACLLLTGPFMLIRKLQSMSLLSDYVRFLVPRHLFGAAMRAWLDARLDNFERAAAVINHLVRLLETETKTEEAKKRWGALLTELYSKLFRLYLMSGNIEAATLLMIRAHNHLGMINLPEYPDYDIRIAHVVKAGIAAGRLLDEGGLATLFMRQGAEPVVTPQQRNIVRRPTPKGEGAKIIPFPRTT